ncbi:PREDICTED: B-cell antigen receptor complex-associated protein beta chain [Nestor notabilis]|uniref:B-cell antigen receptor complex-associated protein beta chain n=1 Tax=Nestor notabilis TaxID=176057 RepID=UPI000523A35B|nr:PREDICTED: B-cell antigen receptor complex-associated protein beta chain [Nestor notabilis]
MADFCSRLWVLQLNLWMMALVTGGISAANSTWNSTDSECITVKQYPRYVGAKKNTPIQFICYFEDPHSIQWYKLVEGSDEFYELGNSSSRYSVQTTNKFTSFTISSITYEDNGIYVCDRKNLTAEQQRPHDCGTQLKVLSHSNIQQVQNRNTLKDAIIIIQSILLVIFISVPILLFLNKGEGKESLEEDHTYEGLEVEQMATYEDITPFRDVKAKWTVGEHPGEE